MIRRSSLIVFEVLVGIFVTCGLGLGIAAWRLSQGPLELPPLKRHVQEQLSEARGGRPVAIDRVELSWEGSERGLQLRARGVKVLDAAGRVLTESATVDIGLDATKLLVGRLAVGQMSASGLEVTFTNAADGSLMVAFGPPGSPADLVIPPPPPNESLSQRVNRALDGFSSAFRPVGLGGSLRRFEVRDVRLTIVDARNGELWRASGASLVLNRDDTVLSLNASAALQGARGAAPASIQIVTDTAFKGAIVDLVARGVKPSALFMDGEFGPASALRAPVTAAVTLGLDRKRGVTLLEGDVSVGAGVFSGFGGDVKLTGARLQGSYDIDSDTLKLEDLSVNGVETRIEGSLVVKDASAILGSERRDAAQYIVSMPKLEIAAPGIFAEPVALRAVSAEGEIRPRAHEITLKRAEASVDGARARFADGRLYWAADSGATSPGLQLTGAVDGVVDARTVVRFWPVKVGETAREWADNGILGGRVSDVALTVDLKPGDADKPALPDKGLSVKFAFEDGLVRYFEGMAPITGGRGRAELKGNRFDLVMDQGVSGAVTLSNGRVELPRLRGGTNVATYAARAEGDARALIELLMQAPIQLRENLPADPATIAGRGEVKFAIFHTLGRHGRRAQEPLRFEAQGELAGVGGVLKEDPRYRISDWAMTVKADERAITLAGPLRLGQSQGVLNWTQSFVSGDETPSRFVIDGRFLASDLSALGYAIADYASGPIGVSVRGVGRGGEIAKADVALDLKDAAMVAPGNMWSKRPARQAKASFVLRGGKQGWTVSELDARGPGLAVSGRAALANDKLMALDLDRLWIDGRTDLKVEGRRDPAGVFRIAADGPMFDGAPFIGGVSPEAATPAMAPPAPKPGQPVERWTATVVTPRLMLRGDAELTGARLQGAWLNEKMTQLIVRGSGPNGSDLALDLGADNFADSGPIIAKADDLGFAYRAMTGANNIRGGSLAASGIWRVADQRADVTLKAENFEVVGAPALARLLSSAFSLTGLAETLNGEGIGFTGAEAPISIAGGQLWIAEGRAAGPSLGITTKGSIELADGSMELDGVLVPSYGLNSALGGLPLFGQLFTSRPGEGVLGMTYSINGPAEAPKVGVNPLSVIAPGIFRRMFEPWAPATTPQAPPKAALKG